MKDNTSTLLIGIFVITAMLFVSPQAFAAPFLVDDFSSGDATSIDSTGTCQSDDTPTGVLGGIRGLFACRDSGSGQVTGEVSSSQYLFRLNQAVGSSGLNYDKGGLLLGGLDITDGGLNDAFRLDIIRSDIEVTVTVDVVDTSGNFGTFMFQILPTPTPTTELVLFSVITDPTSLPIDYSQLDFVGFSFEGSQLNAVNSDLLLGGIFIDDLGVTAFCGEKTIKVGKFCVPEIFVICTDGTIADNILFLCNADNTVLNAALAALAEAQAQRDAILATLFEFLRAFGVI